MPHELSPMQETLHVLDRYIKREYVSRRMLSNEVFVSNISLTSIPLLLYSKGEELLVMLCIQFRHKDIDILSKHA